MADMFSKEQRSKIMSAVRSKENKLTEIRLLNIFRENGIKGWRRHLRLTGNPDFTFRQERVMIFVDGCFWHGCSKHLRMPRTNRDYWVKKISRNMNRDRITRSRLRNAGWKVVRVWEHELQNQRLVVKKIFKALS